MKVTLRPYDGTPDVRGWFFEPGTETFLNVRAVYEEIDRGDFDGWWLASADGTPCAIVGTYDSPHRWINPFIVAPDMRGRGLGTATLLAMIEHPEIPPELWARIDRDNEASRRAFARAGFTEEPKHSSHDTVFVSTSALGTRAPLPQIAHGPTSFFSLRSRHHYREIPETPPNIRHSFAGT